MSNPDELRFRSAPPAGLRAPGRTHPLRHVIRSLDEALTAAGRQLDLAPGSRVLDFGCGDRHYRKLVPPSIDYVGADLPGNPAADVLINPDGTLPFPEQSFEAVMSTQVLEHVSDPGRYLAECRRVLKVGGRLLLSTHGMMYHHRDPVDYWRWTHDGLTKLVQEAGFSVERIRGVLGLAAVGLLLFQMATYRKLPGFLQPFYNAVMQALVAWFDRRYTESTRMPNALVYVLICRTHAEGPGAP